VGGAEEEDAGDEEDGSDHGFSKGQHGWGMDAESWTTEGTKQS